MDGQVGSLDKWINSMGSTHRNYDAAAVLEEALTGHSWGCRTRCSVGEAGRMAHGVGLHWWGKRPEQAGPQRQQVGLWCQGREEGDEDHFAGDRVSLVGLGMT